MADIAEESLLDIEDSAEMVKLNGVVHDKEEGEVVKNTMLHCLSASIIKQTNRRKDLSHWLKKF